MKFYPIVLGIFVVSLLMAACSLPTESTTTEESPKLEDTALLPMGSPTNPVPISVTDTPTQPAPGATEQLIFASTRDGNSDIYRVNGDGSGLANLTGSPSEDTQPVWSPNGTEIAFVSDRAITSTVYLLNIATLETQPLSSTLFAISSPTWSPDGKQIACIQEQNGNTDLLIVKRETGEITTLRQTLEGEEGVAWSPNGKQLAFAALDSTADIPNKDIFVINTDGSGTIVNLTNHPADDTHPAWSPDGSRIAYQSERNGNTDVYVMQANGASQTRLTDNPSFDGMPAWTSDGKYLAFTSWRDGQADIYTMTDSGKEQYSLTSHTGMDTSPNWLPAAPTSISDQVLFAVGSDSNRDIALINTTGTGLSILTTNLVGDHSTPAWSPDGTRIAFASKRPKQEFAIVVMDADGSNPVYLTDGTAKAMHPVWSPDGSKIGFEMKQEGNWDLYTMEPDGKNLKRITANPSREGNITWSPDSRQIAFVSDRDAADNLDIYTMDLAAGSKAERRTTHPEPDVYPAWSPDGTHIVFRSSRNDNKDIYLMSTSDWIPQRMTFSTAVDDQPSWSSDSETIIFASNRVPIEEGKGAIPEAKAGVFHIMMMDRDGFNKTSISSSLQNTTYPVWKPRTQTTPQD